MTIDTLQGHVRHAVIAVLLCTLLPAGARADEGRAVLHDVGALLKGEAENLMTVEKAIEDDISSRSLDRATARRLQARLRQIVARATYLHSFQSVRLVNNLDEYVMQPSPASWDRAKEDLQFMSLSLKELLEEVEHEDPTYRVQSTTWQGALREKHVLERLSAIQPPATREELAEFSRIRVHYTLLVRQVQQMNYSIGDYIGLR